MKGYSHEKKSEMLNPTYKRPTGATPIEATRGSTPMGKKGMIPKNNQQHKADPMATQTTDGRKTSDESKRDYPAKSHNSGSY